MPVALTTAQVPPATEVVKPTDIPAETTVEASVMPIVTDEPQPTALPTDMATATPQPTNIPTDAPTAEPSQPTPELTPEAGS